MPRYTATPLFNAAFDQAMEGVPIVIAGRRYSQYITGWLPGVPLKPSVLGTMEIDAKDERHAAEAVFSVLNRDDRPNGHCEPSLSVGDIVVIHSHDADVPFAIRCIGMDMVNMFEVDEAIIRH